MKTVTLENKMTLNGFTITGDFTIVGDFFHKESCEVYHVVKDKESTYMVYLTYSEVYS